MLQYYEFSHKYSILLLVKIIKFVHLMFSSHAQTIKSPSVQTHYSSIYNPVCFPSHTACCVFPSPIFKPAVFWIFELLWICRSRRRFSPKGSRTSGSRQDEGATGATQQDPGSCASESFLNLSHVYFNICARQGLYHLWTSTRFNERFPVATSELSDDDMMSRSEQEIKRTIIIETESQTADRQKRNTLITSYDTLHCQEASVWQTGLMLLSESLCSSTNNFIN